MAVSAAGKKVAQTTAKFEDEVVVGKDILELLSSSMYIDPLTVYREYVQNSVDAIDQAVSAGLLPDHKSGKIDIILDHIGRRAIVRDNGIGVPAKQFARRMTSFGASLKRGTLARGFRGVGRLAGLGYCQELTFRSRYAGEELVSVLTWDCRQLRELLGDPAYNEGLAELVHRVVSVSKEEPGDRGSHFFEVEVVKPRRIGNDILLNEEIISSFLSQVGPCPFSEEFPFGAEIERSFEGAGVLLKSYSIYINEAAKPICRPHVNAIAYSEGESSSYGRLKHIQIEAADGSLAAIGWIAHHDYLGAIPNSAKVKGLRARVGNIQVGSEKIFSEIFPEERFCSWTVGEVHIVDRRVVPNGRRDDFEQNTHLANLLTQLHPFGHEVARECRSSSNLRNRMKSFEIAEQRIREKVDIVVQGAIAKSDSAKLKREIGAQLSEMRNISGFDLFPPSSKGELSERADKLEALVDELSGTDSVDRSDPLAKLPAAKQKIYREVFSLIYECSVNRVAAKSLIDKMLDRLSRAN